MEQLDEYTKKAIERFVTRVSIADNGCHEWTGATTTSGYGLFFYRGKNMVATRFVMEVMKEGRPLKNHINEVVRHKCDNKICVNPDHLEVGTRMENMKDWQKRSLIEKRKDRKREIQDMWERLHGRK